MEMGKEVLILNLDDVLPNRFQPRIKFNEQSILELADSIREHGVIQPIVVRKIADKYEIIAGERRYKASILAGKTTIPAIVTNLDDKNSAEIALIENVQRQDLTPIEEAISYKKILDMGDINQASLAEKLGKTQSTIANKLRLLNLADEVQEALLEEKISERHARSLLKLNKDHQVQMLNRIMNERMTVRKTDEEISKILNGENAESVANDGNQFEFLPHNNIEILDLEAKEEPKMNDKFNVQNDNDQSKVENVTIPPGFMDIEKIEAQAHDIFEKNENTTVKEEPKEMVLEPINSFEQATINNENNVQPKEESKPIIGRFFNMINRESEENNPNFVKDIEEKEVNMDFNQPASVPIPEFQFQPIDQPKENISSTEQQNLSSNVVNNSFVSPVNETSGFETINPYTLTDDSEFESPIHSQAEIPNILERQVTPVEIQPIVEENIPAKTVDMKTIINTIRDCVNKIESYGYKIDEEEIDLENNYTITITIEK